MFVSKTENIVVEEEKNKILGQYSILLFSESEEQAIDLSKNLEGISKSFIHSSSSIERVEFTLDGDSMILVERNREDITESFLLSLGKLECPVFLLTDHFSEDYLLNYSDGSSGIVQVLQTPLGISQIINALNAEAIRIFKSNERLEWMEQEIESLRGTNQHLMTATFRERDLRKQLQELLDELERVKQKVERQNLEITDSINYAKRIQKAIVATNEQLQLEVSDSFIFFKPRDIVSGDFPWMYANEHFIYVAAVDCTGHGVPGALLSMIGSLLLTDICNNDDDLPPKDVLVKLNDILSRIFSNTEENGILGGMDLALIRIEKKTNKTVFSGAFRPLYWINQQGEVAQIKGTRRSIGSYYYNSEKKFEDVEIDTQKGDFLGFFSDGVPDQLSEEDKKFGRKKVESLLEQNKNEDCWTIGDELNKEMNSWMGDVSQLDDMLFIGLKI